MSIEKRPKGRPRVYPIVEMGVGDYFTIYDEDDVQRVRASISQMKRLHNARDKKFKITKEDDGTYICERVL